MFQAQYEQKTYKHNAMLQDPISSSHPITPTGLSLIDHFSKFALLSVALLFFLQFVKASQKWSTAALQFIFHFFVLNQILIIPFTLHHTLELMVDIKHASLDFVL